MVLMCLKIIIDSAKGDIIESLHFISEILMETLFPGIDSSAIQDCILISLTISRGSEFPSIFFFFCYDISDSDKSAKYTYNSTSKILRGFRIKYFATYLVSTAKILPRLTGKLNTR